MSEERPVLDGHLLAERPTLTLADASERTGIPVDVIRRLWRSLGFALPPGDEPVFLAEDLIALELMHTGVRTGVVDFDTEVRLARAVGQTVARLADWQVSTVAALVEDIESTAQGTGSREASTMRIAEALGDSYEQLLVYAWRRHLGAAVERLSAFGEVGEDVNSVVATVGFADIVAFSALSNELSDDRIGELVEIFETRTADAVTNLGGRAIKTLGDSVLFTADNPVMGLDIAQGIIDVIGGDSRLPDVRLGLATGSVILRFGDVFGPPVNLAARLTAIARRNRVIIDESTARALPVHRYETRALTARPVRGFGVLEPIAVRRI